MRKLQVLRNLWDASAHNHPAQINPFVFLLLPQMILERTRKRQNGSSVRLRNSDASWQTSGTVNRLVL